MRPSDLPPDAGCEGTRPPGQARVIVLLVAQGQRDLPKVLPFAARSGYAAAPCTRDVQPKAEPYCQSGIFCEAANGAHHNESSPSSAG